MTQDEILNMPAGRQMDELIAINLMGWRREENFLLPPLDHPASVNCWAAEWDDEGRPNWLPTYSTNIARAWEVIDKFDGTEFVLHTNQDFKGFPNMPYSANFRLDKKVFLALAETEPLAICRAALLTTL